MDRYLTLRGRDGATWDTTYRGTRERELNQPINFWPQQCQIALHVINAEWYLLILTRTLCRSIHFNHILYNFPQLGLEASKSWVSRRWMILETILGSRYDPRTATKLSTLYTIPNNSVLFSAWGLGALLSVLYPFCAFFLTHPVIFWYRNVLCVISALYGKLYTSRI